jgi:gluconate 2-dehydrogenase alpha chain
VTDAIVVGLGAAGAIVAEQLTRAGMRVVGLDKGPEQTPDDVRFKHDELRYFARAQISPHMGTDPLTWRPDERTPARVLPWNVGPDALGPLFLPPSIGTGGGSVHWACWAWRQRESDFRMRSAIVERFGERALPEGTTLVDWPITYGDLEPYYDRVEWEQGVSGEARANPFEPPRARGYPMPPLRRAAADERFVQAAERLGMHPFRVPVGIASQDYGENRSACTYCGFCRDYPCHVNAKTSTHVTSLPRAAATGNLDLRPFCRVVSVERAADGRTSGMRYLDALGAEHEERAPLVVLACYALENARLLLVSGIDGNGHVGRHYMTHDYGWFTGLLEEWTNPFMGPAVASSAFDDLTSERVPDNDLGVLWGSPTFPSERYFCDLDPTAKDPWGQPALRITHGWEAHDKAAVELLAHTKRDIAREMGMTTFWEAPVDPPYHVSTHELGTHRMGDDPAASVVDRFGEVHTCPGLYAIGGGQFPTLGAYNPTETIMALAYFSADHILEAADGR